MDDCNHDARCTYVLLPEHFWDFDFNLVFFVSKGEVVMTIRKLGRSKGSFVALVVSGAERLKEIG